MERPSTGNRLLRTRQAFAYSILFFFLSPFLILIWKFPLHPQFDFSEFAWALKNTLMQAGLSAVGSLLLGTWAALGLISMGPRVKKILEVICLVPNFLPPLFTLLIIFYWVDPFPTGFIGIGLIHSVINFGLVAVSLSRTIESKLGGMAELAAIEGSSRFHFLKNVFIPTLKNDYAELFLFVFSICFVSFSIPLIVGGGKGTTLEVLIYEKIRLSMDWGGAVLISILQFLILAFFARWFVRIKILTSVTPRQIRWLGFKSGAGLIMLFAILFVVGYLDSILAGAKAAEQFLDWKDALIKGTLGTLFIGFTTGALILFLLISITFSMGFSWLRRWLQSYIAPSTTLTGFAFLVLGPNEGFLSYFKIPLALALIFCGVLYRMGWESEVQRLSGQVATAEIIGASRWNTFKFILWPQVEQRALLLAGLAAAWACGDFALSRILAYNDMTLALMTETLMSTYRLGLASLLSVAVLLSALFCFFTFWGFGYVYRRKSS